jgi:Dolichyl-phosphate-mannose-protein mannosyltransferase
VTLEHETRYTGLLFLLLSLTLGLTALTVRGVIAFGTHQVVDWDETYYASTTATAAHGLGVYPYVLGYPPIPDMGGMGYIVFLYVVAYRLLGPELIVLRLVSFVISLLGVAGLFVWTRRLYGSAAGLATLALTPSLVIFQLSNTIRFDVFAMAFVAWALVVYSYVADTRVSIGWHVLVGVVFALGLEVHLHTAAAAFAVGLAYLTDAIGALKQKRTSNLLAMKPVAGFVAGYAMGAMLFFMVNVLPNPTGFFRTAALARLSAADSGKELNLTARMDLPRLVQTFLSPRLIVPKEVARYRGVFGQMRWWEALLWLCGVPTFLLLRPTPQALRERILFCGAILGAGIVFNAPSVLYTAAILPFVVPALTTFVTHGFSKKGQITWTEVSASSLALMLVLSVAILPPLFAKTAPAIARVRHPDSGKVAPPIVALVKNIASPACILAGPTDLYAEYFMAYPKFVGTRLVEVSIGSTYYDLQDNPVRYWTLKRPDVVFGSPSEGLAAYLVDARYIPTVQDVWRKPGDFSEGCVLTIK